MLLFSVSLVLLFLMDPLGNIASYLTLMQGLSPKRQKFILLREMLIALATMIAFFLVGEYVFKFLGICQTTIRLTSGVILFLIALKIIFPSANGLRTNLPKGEPFIIPLAIPLIAGPALLATIVLYSQLPAIKDVLLPAILIAWICSCGILLIAPFLQRTLQTNGLLALEKLIGMVLILMATQRFAEGIQQFIKESC